VKKKQRKRYIPAPLLGSEAFGTFGEQGLTGSESVGEPDDAHPLRGALVFGNDPAGEPRGAEAVGEADSKNPLRGALLFGNDPEGNPRGSEAFGEPEEGVELKGALLFGNDPNGDPRGSESIGQPNSKYEYLGSEAVGAPQQLPETLMRDDIGYDFGGVMLRPDDSSLAGVRKDPNDRLRQRILGILRRTLSMDVDKLRHGLGENSIKWGLLKREPDMDRKLAEDLRERYRKAPGEVLGIAHVRELLEETERMHTFRLRCEWESKPIKITILWDDQPVAFAESTLHKEHEFYILRSTEGEVLGYVDTFRPERADQTARVRTPKGELVSTVEVTTPTFSDTAKEEGIVRLQATITDRDGKAQLEMEEERATSKFFRAKFSEPGQDEEVGRIEDRLLSGKIQSDIELDIPVAPTLAWAVAAIMADLARSRRDGWPDKPIPSADEIEPIEQALGPRRRVRDQVFASGLTPEEFQGGAAQDDTDEPADDDWADEIEDDGFGGFDALDDDND